MAGMFEHLQLTWLLKSELYKLLLAFDYLLKQQKNDSYLTKWTSALKPLTIWRSLILCQSWHLMNFLNVHREEMFLTTVYFIPFSQHIWVSTRITVNSKLSNTLLHKAHPPHTPPPPLLTQSYAFNKTGSGITSLAGILKSLCGWWGCQKETCSRYKLEHSVCWHLRGHRIFAHTHSTAIHMQACLFKCQDSV